MRSSLSIAASISAWAQQLPDALAILTSEGSLTYAELDRAVAWTADRFRTKGVRQGDIVGIRLENRLQHLMTALSLVRLGASHLSFHISDPPQRQQEVARRLNLAIMVADKSPKSGEDISLIAPPPDRPSDYKQLPPTDMPTVIDGDLPCVLMASSGTTGEPKVCALTQARTQQRLRQSGYGLPSGPGTRFLSLPHLSFHGAKYQVLSCLSTGGCAAFLHGTDSVEDLVEFVREHEINYLAGGPVHAHTLLTLAKDDGHLLPDLDAFRLSTTLVTEPLRQAVRERLTPNLHVAYGIAEVGFVTAAPPSMLDQMPGIVGKPLPGVTAEVTDANGDPLPPGEAGELRVRSPSMVDGYIGDAEQTARAFRDGWFYTRDLLKATPEGTFVHFGRADDVMIMNGINIYPAEIENVLLKHPAVVEAAAFPVKHQVKGDMPAAAIVARSEVSDDELRAHCRAWLGAKAPHRVLRVDRLPRNAVGKVLRRELEESLLGTLEPTSPAKKRVSITLKAP